MGPFFLNSFFDSVFCNFICWRKKIVYLHLRGSILSGCLLKDSNRASASSLRYLLFLSWLIFWEKWALVLHYKAKATKSLQRVSFSFFLFLAAKINDHPLKCILHSLSCWDSCLVKVSFMATDWIAPRCALTYGLCEPRSSDEASLHQKQRQCYQLAMC